jgi:hypothetical protein
VEAVARHRHFTRVAEELHIAQTALSHQIGRLEQELGARPRFAVPAPFEGLDPPSINAGAECDDARR